jgi:hypothetical protein
VFLWKASEMFKNVVVSVFVAVISLASISAVATTEESIWLAKKSLSTVNSVISKQSLVDVTDIGSTTSSYEIKGAIVKSHNNETREPTLFSGWLLAIALFGFVMMSNRRGV